MLDSCENIHIPFDASNDEEIHIPFDASKGEEFWTLCLWHAEYTTILLFVTVAVVIVVVV